MFTENCEKIQTCPSIVAQEEQGKISYLMKVKQLYRKYWQTFSSRYTHEHSQLIITHLIANYLINAATIYKTTWSIYQVRVIKMHRNEKFDHKFQKLYQTINSGLHLHTDTSGSWAVKGGMPVISSNKIIPTDHQSAAYPTCIQSSMTSTSLP